MKEAIRLRFSVSRVLVLYGPLFGDGIEVAKSPAYGRARSGTIRTYVNVDTTYKTLSMQFSDVPEADWNNLLTWFSTTDILLDHMSDAIVIDTYSGKITTPILEGTRDRYGCVSFQLQFVGRKL